MKYPTHDPHTTCPCDPGWVWYPVVGWRLVHRSEDGVLAGIQIDTTDTPPPHPYLSIPPLSEDNYLGHEEPQS